MLEWLKDKLNAERSAVVGVAVTVLWWLNDVVVSGDASDWRMLAPIITGLIVRIFVTSEGVRPGWRRERFPVAVEWDVEA